MVQRWVTARRVFRSNQAISQYPPISLVKRWAVPEPRPTKLGSYLSPLTSHLSPLTSHFSLITSHCLLIYLRKQSTTSGNRVEVAEGWIIETGPMNQVRSAVAHHD